MHFPNFHPELVSFQWQLLNRCYSIKNVDICIHNGRHITAENEKQKSTFFSLCIPACAEQLRVSLYSKQLFKWIANCVFSGNGRRNSIFWFWKRLDSKSTSVYMSIYPGDRCIIINPFYYYYMFSGEFIRPKCEK